MVGGLAASDTLLLTSTSSATKGKIWIGASGSYGSFYDESENNLGIGVGYSATAQLHIGGGGSAAGSACLKFTSGVLLTRPEAGAWEFKGDDIYFTITTGTVRKAISFIDGVLLKTSRIPYSGAKGFLDSGYLQFSSSTNTIGTKRIELGQFPEVASYGNAFGSGYRVGYITTSASAGLVTGATAGLVDGIVAATTNLYFIGSAVDPTTYLRFNFGTGFSQIITEATWYQQGSQTHGVWQWQGSNDASSWTNIGATFTFGGVITQVQTTLSANTTGYQYYQLVGVSGTTTAAPYIYEMEFKTQNTLFPAAPANSYLSAFDIVDGTIQNVITNGSTGSTSAAEWVASAGGSSLNYIKIGSQDTGSNNASYLKASGGLGIRSGTGATGPFSLVIGAGGDAIGNVRMYMDGASPITTVVGQLKCSSFVAGIRTITSSPTIDLNDYTLLCDATSAAFTVTLPTASAHSGRIFNIKKIDTTANKITVPTLDGSTQYLVRQGECFTCQSDGTNWWVI